MLPNADRANRARASIGCELYGVPRLRAGTARVEVAGNTLGEALADLLRQCPALSGGILETEEGFGRVHPAYRLSLNGDRFVSNPSTPLADGDTLLLIAADVGG
jgi:molybdopterin converting factor small subunit